MQITNIIPLVLNIPGATVARTSAAPEAAWFDDPADPGDLQIRVELGAESRALSIEQHAERVLAFLCGQRDVG